MYRTTLKKSKRYTGNIRNTWVKPQHFIIIGRIRMKLLYTTQLELQFPLLQGHRETTVPHSFICGPYEKGFFTKMDMVFLTLKCLILECHLAAFREVTFLTVPNPMPTQDPRPPGTPQLREFMLCTLGPVGPQVVPTLWNGRFRAKAADAE